MSNKSEKNTEIVFPLLKTRPDEETTEVKSEVRSEVRPENNASETTAQKRRELTDEEKREILEKRRKRRMMRRLKRDAARAGLAAILLLILLLAVKIVDWEHLEMPEVNLADATAQYGEDYVSNAQPALLKGRLFHRRGIEVEVTHTDNVNPMEMGTYEETIIARKGLKRVKSVRKVIVADTMPPVIELVKDPDYFVDKKEAYMEEGFSATDNYDGDVTSQVTSVTDSDAGTVTYTVTDSHGNTASVVREIPYAEKLVYLTFDDGPGKYTQQLLDILKKYDVKATFFVTNQFAGYVNDITRAAEEGHTVAIHSYTHTLSKVYKSTDAYFADVEKMAAVIEEKTGKAAIPLVRFPGGSGNTISRKYKKGIMKDITRLCDQKGYHYCDWNVNSTDADNVTDDPQVIADTVIREIQKHDVSYVLQHDIKEYSVEAVESIIKWGLENGYTFRPITMESAVYHGPVRN